MAGAAAPRREAAWAAPLGRPASKPGGRRRVPGAVTAPAAQPAPRPALAAAVAPQRRVRAWAGVVGMAVFSCPSSCSTQTVSRMTLSSLCWLLTLFRKIRMPMKKPLMTTMLMSMSMITRFSMSWKTSLISSTSWMRGRNGCILLHSSRRMYVICGPRYESTRRLEKGSLH